jgi:hypothetical protein
MTLSLESQLNVYEISNETETVNRKFLTEIIMILIRFEKSSCLSSTLTFVQDLYAIFYHVNR